MNFQSIKFFWKSLMTRFCLLIVKTWAKCQVRSNKVSINELWSNGDDFSWVWLTGGKTDKWQLCNWQPHWLIDSHTLLSLTHSQTHSPWLLSLCLCCQLFIYYSIYAINHKPLLILHCFEATPTYMVYHSMKWLLF